MKPRNKQLLTGLFILTPIAATAQIPAGLEGYTHYLELNPIDNTGTPLVGTVGSWSWEDSRLGDGVFWRHQSDWIAINLVEASRLQFRVERNQDEGDNSKLFPSFTLYTGFNDTAEGSHFGSNTADVQWVTAGTPSRRLTYLDHHNNSTSGTIDKEMILPAGEYTILLGGNALAEAQAVNVNYTATLTASPIPETSTSLFSLVAALTLLARRKR